MAIKYKVCLIRWLIIYYVLFKLNKSMYFTATAAYHVSPRNCIIQQVKHTTDRVWVNVILELFVYRQKQVGKMTPYNAILR